MLYAKKSILKLPGYILIVMSLILHQVSHCFTKTSNLEFFFRRGRGVVVLLLKSRHLSRLLGCGFLLIKLATAHSFLIATTRRSASRFHCRHLMCFRFRVGLFFRHSIAGFLDSLGYRGGVNCINEFIPLFLCKRN